MSVFAKQDYPVKWIPVGQIAVVWPHAQRPENERAITVRMETFDPDCFGVVTVTQPNKEGIYHAIDGQTRTEAVRRLWGDKEMVPCMVLNVSNPKDAARIFRKMNNGRQRPTAIQDFRVGLTEGDTEITEVNNILSTLGLRAGDGDDGHISAVSTCRTIHRRHGPEVLADALKTIKATWGKSRDAYHGNIIAGFAELAAKHNGSLDRRRLAERTAKKFTPASFIGAARQARDFQGGSLTYGVTSTLVNTYNTGLAVEKRLPLD